MSMEQFHPLIREWFLERFDAPTEPQQRGWPLIANGQNTLIAAPTGSGKTLAAFLVCLDRLFREWTEGKLEDGIQVVYVSPLKALSNDIQRNLQTPLAEISRLAEAAGLDAPKIRVAVRTGDTPSSERQAMLRKPPHILVTTPESLYLLLTAEKSRALLRNTNTVIVDEIHALARDKRGSHLALTLERLHRLAEAPPVRVGLSATQRPIDQIASFLVGAAATEDEPPRPCEVIDGGHFRELDLAVSVPDQELSAVCSHEQWGDVYEQLTEMIQGHRSTLVFVNTRRLAERVAHHLRETLGEEAVASHHGSLSREIRLSAEQRLKSGELKAIVATASLEMGIDIGYIDLVCQIGSPRAIASFLQRVGRSGHSIGATPKGRIFPLTRDELLESMALVHAVYQQRLDAIEIPMEPVDILAQQLIAEVAAEEDEEERLFDMVRRAWPFRELSRERFEKVLSMASNGVAPRMKRGAYLHWDQIGHKVRARRGARLAAITSGGAIPETAQYRVVTEDDKTFVGSLDEDFAIESTIGDVFLLGNTSWRVRRVKSGEVIVQDAQGAPPSIPFWFGEGPGRTIELSEELSRLRRRLADWVEAEAPDEAMAFLRSQCGADAHAADQAFRYVNAQCNAVGCVPTTEEVVYERFFDESGGMQLVIHAPFGARVNRAWGLAMRKRFCRSFDFELQAAADDNGVLLSMSPQHSFPLSSMFHMIGPHNAKYLLEQALLAAPMFQVRWRWNVTRALAVLRTQAGKKTPPHLQRFRSDDLLAAVFPETVGCLENHHGDVEIPDHPLVHQTMHDCFHEAMDFPRWFEVVEKIKGQQIRLIEKDTREPSPFAHELLNANPYSFLDDAPLEERRTRAVATRRSLNPDDFQDLASLDPEAIQYVTKQAWPTVRDADELHDAMMTMVAVLPGEMEGWMEWFQELVELQRATCVETGSKRIFIAAERWPWIKSLYPDAVAQPKIDLPKQLQVDVESTAAIVEMTRGRMTHSGPLKASFIAESLGLGVEAVVAALEALEGEGTVMRGNFSTSAGAANSALKSEAGNRAPAADIAADKITLADLAVPAEVEPDWCERRLLARIHRLTLEGLRQRIKPVRPEHFVDYLVHRHNLHPGRKWGGPVGLRELIALLQGFELPAAAWEARILTDRVADYDAQWLDHLFMSGEAVWGRLTPPRRDQDKRSAAAMTRQAPITISLREAMAWLAPEELRERAKLELPDPAIGTEDDPNHAQKQSPQRSNRKKGRRNGSAKESDNIPMPAMTSYAQDVYAALQKRGALFYQELKQVSQLLPGHLDTALAELAALGLATSDSYAAIRAIVSKNKKSGRRRLRGAAGMASPVGRWSVFPSTFDEVDGTERLLRWCKQLLTRYGVVFRDLLVRESAAPPWRQLAPILRRMELRGEVRGGRFVEGVAGEQFAEPNVVEGLRNQREAELDDWIVVSAADPVNLAGVVTDEPRVSAIAANSMVLWGGRCVAASQGGRIEFFVDQPPEIASQMRHALQTGRRQEPRDWAAKFKRRRTRNGENDPHNESL